MFIMNIAIIVSMILLFVVMTIIFSNKRTKSKRKIWEENIQKQVIKDLEKNKKRYGLWKMALKESNGLEDICKSLYITYCVQSIIGEHEILGTVRL